MLAVATGCAFPAHAESGATGLPAGKPSVLSETAQDGMPGCWQIRDLIEKIRGNLQTDEQATENLVDATKVAVLNGCLPVRNAPHSSVPTVPPRSRAFESPESMEFAYRNISAIADTHDCAVYREKALRHTDGDPYNVENGTGIIKTRIEARWAGCDATSRTVRSAPLD